MLRALRCPDCGAPASGSGECAYCRATLVEESSGEADDAWIGEVVASLRADRFGDAWNLFRRRLPSLDHETRNRMIRDGRVVSLLGEWVDEAREERSAGRTLGAIKLVRDNLRVGLSEAKQLVAGGELDAPDFLYRARARIIEDARQGG